MQPKLEDDFKRNKNRLYLKFLALESFNKMNKLLKWSSHDKSLKSSLFLIIFVI